MHKFLVQDSCLFVASISIVVSSEYNSANDRVAIVVFSGDSRLVSGDVELSRSDAAACQLDMFAFSNALSSSGY